MSKKNTATVVLKVSEFNPLPLPPATSPSFLYTSCKVKLCRGTPRVIKTPDTPSGPADPDSLTVRICMGRRPLHFRIKIAGEDQDHVYHPVGIAFKEGPCRPGTARLSTSKGRGVHGNFPEGSVKIVNDVLCFTDKCRKECDKHAFDYYVIIQEEGTDLMGIIDPGITHDEPQTK